jgi:protein-S-isoprenylcysteine O-methyltransferase Ste14
MNEKMSRWGIGPVFASLSIGYGIIILAISRFYQPIFQIDFIPHRLLVILGVALIAAGVPFFIRSVSTVTRAYNADALVTDGVFRCCRHPLYASWVVFIVPGIILLSNSWIGLTTPIFMYLLLSKLVRKEEVYLESIFGSEYVDYKRKVPCILPYGTIKNRMGRGTELPGV